MFRRLSIALLAVTVCVPLSTAQRRGGSGWSASGAHAHFARGVGRVGFYRGRWPVSGAGFLGYPFLYPDSDSPDAYLAGNPENSTPQVVIMQPASGGVAPRSTRPSPLLIEWRGDRYVRFGGVEAKEERGSGAHPDYAEPAVPKLPSVAEKPAGLPPRQVPPTVLVYRDGHREEIPDYAIADGVIYVRGSDWQNGAWTRHIPLSALDPSATLQANQERGAKFMLPSASNVVTASF